jgi:hypothetical protein
MSRLSKVTVFLLSCSLLLSTCATAPSSGEAQAVETRLAHTDDLAIVAEDALSLSEELGKDQVLVVFDIDNTLLAMEQGLGSDQWYDWQKDLQREDPCNGALVEDRLAVQGALYFASAMRLTQPDAPEWVGRLQDQGIKVIALTSRGSSFRLQTFRELRRNGFSFYSSAIGPMQGYAEEFVPAGGSRPARYEDGVFLTAGQHKGAMLKALLDKTGSAYPAVIVMADDKERNLQAVLETFEDEETKVHAWRYGREDEAVALFDGQEATASWQQIRPALQTIQVMMGPDNFDFPQQVVREGCGARSE